MDQYQDAAFQPSLKELLKLSPKRQRFPLGFQIQTEIQILF